VTKAVRNLVGQQFLLQEDAQALRTDAAQSGFGK
jgi:hypothetical protein